MSKSHLRISIVSLVLHNSHSRTCLIAQRYDSCTDYKDPNGKKWCSTRTSNSSVSLHVHIGKKEYWGYCEEDCLKKDVGSCSDYTDQGFKCIPADEGCKSEVIRRFQNYRMIRYLVFHVLYVGMICFGKSWWKRNFRLMIKFSGGLIVEPSIK